MPAARPPFSLAFAADVGAAHVPFIRRHLRKAHAILRPPLRELSVALVGDKRMSELHERFLDIPGPTDVLTFPLDADGRGRVLSGEVVVCVPEARRQAKNHKVPVERELLLYALHGLLHLCGYDDRTDAAFRAMHHTEDQILTRLGVGPVFEAADEGVGHGGRRATSSGRPRRRAPRPPSRAATGGSHGGSRRGSRPGPRGGAH